MTTTLRVNNTAHELSVVVGLTVSMAVNRILQSRAGDAAGTTKVMPSTSGA